MQCCGVGRQGGGEIWGVRVGGERVFYEGIRITSSEYAVHSKMAALIKECQT